MELERSLLNAEFDCETQKISKAKMKIALLRHKETRLSGSVMTILDFIMRKVKFDRFMHPNEHPQMIFWYPVRPFDKEP